MGQISMEKSQPAGSVLSGNQHPEITVADIVAAQRALLMDLGVDRLVAVVGPSYGGFQAFQLSVSRGPPPYDSPTTGGLTPALPGFLPAASSRRFLSNYCWLHENHASNNCASAQAAPHPPGVKFRQGATPDPPPGIRWVPWRLDSIH
jgi:hypothetical protein